MDKSRVYLISCSDHYGHRFRLMDEQLQEMGYDTTYITSDFDHSGKCRFTCKVPGCVQLPVMPYKRNLSVQRIISHWQFARKAYAYLQNLENEPAAIIGLLPPNFLAFYLARYKTRHKAVKLIFDVFDLWPETFPAAGAKKIVAPIFSVWAWLRERSIPKADHVLAECEYFRNKLNLPRESSSTVYLHGEPLNGQFLQPELAMDRWNLCYLGAVNNVIGIADICALVEKLQQKKPVTVHIIGAGERIDEFTNRVRQTGATAVCYGPVYQDLPKQEIIRQCHFGLNIVHPEACIGLTMKSVEYFRQGLPVINNVPADTQNLLERYDAGIQLGQDTAQFMDALTSEDCLSMRNNVRTMFEAVFSRKSILTQHRTLLEAILGDKYE